MASEIKIKGLVQRSILHLADATVRSAITDLGYPLTGIPRTEMRQLLKNALRMLNTGASNM
ncbi:MAG: hypothetical protein ACP5M9_00975 [Candidatus Micrarchaeia archaeon]